ARSGVFTAWFDSAVVATRDLRTPWLDQPYRRRFRCGSTNTSVRSNDRAVVDPDELPRVASSLLPACSWPDQRLLLFVRQRLRLRRAPRARRTNSDWLRRARAYAFVRVVRRGFLQHDGDTCVRACSRFGPWFDGSPRGGPSRATECDHPRGLFAAVAEHTPALAISVGPTRPACR